MTISYHEGELGVQERAGVRAMAERIGRSVHGSVPPFARHLLATQRFAVLAVCGRRREGLGLATRREVRFRQRAW